MKKVKYLILSTALMIAGICLVYAAGSATASVGGLSSVTINDEVSYNVVISNLSGIDTGVTGLQGIVKYDTSYFSFVSSTPMTSPLTVQENKTSDGTYNIVGSTMGTGFSSDSTVYTIKLKAIKEGTTSVELSDFYITDFAANLIKCNTSNKSVTISSKSNVDPTPTPTKSSDSKLSGLSVDGYSLSPSFDAGTKNYTITVDSNTSSVNVNASANSSVAGVSGTGNISLTGDSTQIPVTVTAEDGSKTTYTITVKKSASSEPVVTKSSDATLKSLDVSGYTLSPSFNKDKTTYSMKVKSNISGLNVSAIPNDSNSTVEVTGNSGWQSGVNTINVKVTAEDGTTKTYIVNVIKDEGIINALKNSDSSLKELSIANGDISPEFDKSTTDYSITIPSDVDTLDISAIPTNSKSTVEITNNEDFEIGKVKSVLVTVTAEDGSKSIYTINVTKSPNKSNNKLNDIIITNGDLQPEFDPNTFDYTVNIDDNVSSLDLTTATDNSNAKIEVLGNEDLDKGSNKKVVIKVVDENGFVQYYKLSIKRDESNIITILGLKIPKWLFFIIVLGLLALIILFILLFKRKKKEEEPEKEPVQQPVIPRIEIKPEFNFGSKNGTDDDIVEPGGINNQYSGNKYNLPHHEDDNLNQNAIDAKVVDSSHVDKVNSVEELPYDPYDDVVTKDELFDAIQKAKKTNDATMLNMLLAQEKLNRAKERMKKENEGTDRQD